MRQQSWWAWWWSVAKSPAGGRCVKRLAPAITIGSLRMLNTYESAGVFEGRQSRLDDLILEHLATQAELAKLNAWEETLCRMTVEGYSRVDIAKELHCHPDTVGRKIRRVKWSLLGQ